MFGLKGSIQHIPAATGGDVPVLCGLRSVAGGARRLGVRNRTGKIKSVGEKPVLGRCLGSGWKPARWVFSRVSPGKTS